MNDPLATVPFAGAGPAPLAGTGGVLARSQVLATGPAREVSPAVKLPRDENGAAP